MTVARPSVKNRKGFGFVVLTMAWVRVVATSAASLGSRRPATTARPSARGCKAFGSVVLAKAWARGAGNGLPVPVGRGAGRRADRVAAGVNGSGAAAATGGDGMGVPGG